MRSKRRVHASFERAEMCNDAGTSVLEIHGTGRLQDGENKDNVVVYIHPEKLVGLIKVLKEHAL
jgi:hypothetical protein